MPNKHADIRGHHALMFVNNPHVYGEYPDQTGMEPGWDVITAPDPTGYSVQVNAKSIGDGDIGVVYRVDEGAVLRQPGRIVAVVRIISSPWHDRNGYAGVTWQLQLLPPEAWIPSGDMKASGLWEDRVPLSRGKQVSQPVYLDPEQWEWLAARLPRAAFEWLDEHASGNVSLTPQQVDAVLWGNTSLGNLFGTERRETLQGLSKATLMSIAKDRFGVFPYDLSGATPRELSDLIIGLESAKNEEEVYDKLDALQHLDTRILSAVARRRGYSVQPGVSREELVQLFTKELVAS